MFFSTCLNKCVLSGTGIFDSYFHDTKIDIPCWQRVSSSWATNRQHETVKQVQSQGKQKKKTYCMHLSQVSISV